MALIIFLGQNKILREGGGRGDNFNLNACVKSLIDVCDYSSYSILSCLKHSNTNLSTKNPCTQECNARKVNCSCVYSA